MASLKLACGRVHWCVLQVLLRVCQHLLRPGEVCHNVKSGMIYTYKLLQGLCELPVPGCRRRCLMAALKRLMKRACELVCCRHSRTSAKAGCDSGRSVTTSKNWPMRMLPTVSYT